jgi:MFS family permease
MHTFTAARMFNSNRIMFRWVQGIGGCGVLVLGQLIFFDILPPKKYVPYTTLVTSVITFSLIGGPLIGGGITLHGLWRWVFLVKYVFHRSQRFVILTVVVYPLVCAQCSH